MTPPATEPQTNTASHREHLLEKALAKSEQLLATAMANGNAEHYGKTLEMLRAERNKDIEKALAETEAKLQKEEPKKEYSDDFFGREQRKKDERLDMVRGIMNKINEESKR